MKIAMLPGDGIGTEIVAEAAKVLERLRRDGLPIETETAPIGGAGYDAAGQPLPEATLAIAQARGRCRTRGRWRTEVRNPAAPLRPEQGLLAIRKALGLFANLRPAILYPELASSSSLKPEVVSGLDIMIVRELTGDIYFGAPRGRRVNAAGDAEGFDTMLYSEPEIRRIARFGFEVARKRKRRLCSVDKANVLDTSILWREVVSSVANGLLRRRAYAYVCRQRCHAARARTQAIRRDRDRQHVRRHPFRRGIDAGRARSECCRRLRSTPTTRGSTSRFTVRRPTSPVKTRRIRWRRSCRWR